MGGRRLQIFNHTTIKSANKLLKVIPLLLVFFTVWVVCAELPNKTVTGKYFWFYGTMLFVSLAVFLSSIFERKVYRFSLLDVLITLFCLLGLAVTWFNKDSGSNKLVILLLLLPLHFSFRYILQNNQQGRNILLFFLLFIGFVEAIWGLAQLYGFCRSYHHLYPATGSFFNPGPYAGYLALVVPVAAYYGLNDCRAFGQKCNQRYLPFYIRGMLSLLTIVCIIMILPSAMSRAAWIAASSGGLFAVGSYYRRKRKLTRYLRFVAGNLKYVFILVICLLLAGAYYLKKDSADGRWLIWKVSTRVIAQHPLGVGLGNFPGSYGEQQAAYFASGAGSAQEQYVAGNPEYSFNEYLQIGVEFGALGLLLFIAMVSYSVYSGIKTKRYAAVGSLFSLLIFAAMSYPFNVLPFVIVFVFLLSCCVLDENQSDHLKPSGRYATIAIFGVFMIVTFSGSFRCISTYHAYEKWITINMLKIDMLRDNVLKNDHRLRDNVLTLCAEIYYELKHEIRFVFDYATLLKDDGQYEESNRVLWQGMKISCDPVLYNLAGTNYQMMKDYKTAESYFKKAADMVPNRLYPYYLLAKLYVDMGLPNQACEMAKIVQTKEQKVNSQAVIEMREEMEKICTK